MNSNLVAIQISNLTKTFGTLTAVDQLSLQITQGEIFGFLGPNGAGKTTSINMICGLLPPSKGEIYFWGKKINNNNEIKTQIGICPQENIYWPKLTCHEQLMFAGEMYAMRGKHLKKRSQELLEFLGLADKSKTLASKLSGGMKRRLNICLALIHDPAILVLDEPEAGLDPQSRVLVREFIKSLAKQKTIILTTHNMDEADRLAERVAIIDHGKLLMLDTPENLKNSVGEGDVLEIKLENPASKKMEKLIKHLATLCEKVTRTDSVLKINSKHLLEIVADITSAIKKNGLKIIEMTLRENTLEDVFIHLTGRTLRQ